MVIALEAGSPLKPNEDWADIRNGIAVVLDGVSATGGTSCGHSPAWFVDLLGPALRNAAQDEQSTLRDALATAIKATRAAHADCDVSGGGPAAAVAVVRHRGDRVEWLALADCTVAVRTTHEVLTFTDRRVDDALDPDLRAAVLTEEYGTPEQQRAAIAMSRDQLARRNVHGGYWVAADDPNAADEAHSGAVPADTTRDTALLTDGASALVDVYQQCTWPELLDMIVADGAESVIRAVRNAESEDTGRTRWPRLKRSDDAAIAYMDIDERLRGRSAP